MIDLKAGDYLKKTIAKKLDKNRVEYCTIIYLCLQISDVGSELPTAIVTPIVKHIGFWETSHDYDDVKLGYTIQIVKAREESIFQKRGAGPSCSWKKICEKWIWDTGCAILPFDYVSLPNPRDLNTVIVERLTPEENNA